MSELPEEKKENNLPPFPTPILEMTEDDLKMFGEVNDSSDPDVISRNVSKKLYNIWALYGWICNNKDIIDIVNEHCLDTHSSLYKLQHNMVFIVDKLSKILSRGNIMTEFTFLQK